MKWAIEKIYCLESKIVKKTAHDIMYVVGYILQDCVYKSSLTTEHFLRSLQGIKNLLKVC